MADTEKDRLIQRLGELETRRIRQFARENSLPFLSTTLTIQQLKVLLILTLDGDMATHELAERVSVGVATVTGIVDRLVARELVERHEDPMDRRVRRVRLTEKGHSLAEEMYGASLRSYRPIVERLDTATLRGLVAGLEALCDAVDERPSPHPSP